GHTLDDQAETVLMRLLRGSGLDGLAGIPPVRESGGIRIGRPLSETARAEVEAYIRSVGAQSREDATNRDLAILRNRIRRVLLPILEGYNPDVKQALARVAALLRDEADAIETLGAAQIAGVLSGDPPAVQVAVSPFARLPVALQRRALRGAVRRVPGDRRAAQAAWAEVVVLDRGQVGDELVLRGPRPGDRFAPAGMGGRTKMVAEYLSDEKVPRHRRLYVPVLTTEHGAIVWIVGMR